MSKKLLFLTLYICISINYFSTGQSAFVPLNEDYYHLIDRFEIKRGKEKGDTLTNILPPKKRYDIIHLHREILGQDSRNGNHRYLSRHR